MSILIASPIVRTEIRLEGGLVWRPSFDIGGERWVYPLAEAPWSGRVDLDPCLPPYVRRLGGAFIGLPFGGRRVSPGATAPWDRHVATKGDEPLHGFAASATWTEIATSDDATTLRLEPRDDGVVAHLVHRVACGHEVPELRSELDVGGNRDGLVSAGFHPILALPSEPGTCRLEASFRCGYTYPWSLGAAARTMPGVEFGDLRSVPGIGGKELDLSLLPHGPPLEDLVLLCGIDGPVRLAREDDGFEVIVDWDRASLPNCLLWFSEGTFALDGSTPPFRGLGIEPTAAAFDLSDAVSVGPNPLSEKGERTSLTISRSEPTRTWCTITVKAYEVANER